MNGKVYLVGAGPGDPDLLTLKALRILENAEVVIYDRLVSDEILSLINPNAHLVYAGKRKGQQDEIQEEIYCAFLQHAKGSKIVVRLKSGDPTVFGRSGEEMAFLEQHGIDAEIIPGISSALAAPALSGIPLTLRNIATSFTVIAGHRESLSTVDWSAYSRINTLIILMGVENRGIIARGLLEVGRPPDEPVALIEHVSTSHERVIITTLAEIRDGVVEVDSPAVIVIGEVVRHRTARSRPETRI